MSHELTEQDTMMSANGRVPWHMHLGTPVRLVEGEVTVADAPALAGLEWTVEHRPVYVRTEVGVNEDGTFAYEYHEVPDKRAVVRNDLDTVLNVVGPQHTLVQNQALFDLAAALQAEGGEDVLIETAGSLQGGAKVWVLAKLNRELVVEGDEHVPYLLLANAHDGTMSLRVQNTPIRVVCWNTLSWAIASAKQAWTARHSDSITGRVSEIQQALRLSYSYLDAWEEDARRMMATTVRKPQFDKFVERVVPIDPNPTDRMVGMVQSRRDRIHAIYDGPTVGPFKGTAWGAIQAATEWSQWDRPVSGASRAERQGLSVVAGERVADNNHLRTLLARSVPALAGKAGK